MRPIAGVGGSLIYMQVDGLNRLLSFIEADERFREMDREIAVAILAYFLATVLHETTIAVRIDGKKVYVPSFQPVEEMGGVGYLNRMYDTRTDLGNTPQRDGDGARYAGDGYVQNTGATNARTTGRLLAGMKISYSDIPADKSDLLAAFAREGGSARTPITIDSGTFLREHELLRVPRISYLDSMNGMLTGRYTGKKISQYVNATETDFFKARLTINGIVRTGKRKNVHKVKEIEAFAYKIEKALFASLMPDDPAESELVAGVATVSSPSETQEELTPAPIAADHTPIATQAGASGNIQALIPHIDTAKGWMWKLFGGTALGTVYTFYTGQSPEIRYALLGLLFLIVAGVIVMFVKYHDRVFDFAQQAMKINADPTLPNVTLKADSK
jgi:hypothetical protein